MVQFNETSFSIEVETGTLPAENYVATVNDIIDLLQDSGSSELRGDKNYYYLLELLRAMTPDEKQVKKLSA